MKCANSKEKSLLARDEICVHEIYLFTCQGYIGLMTFLQENTMLKMSEVKKKESKEAGNVEKWGSKEAKTHEAGKQASKQANKQAGRQASK